MIEIMSGNQKYFEFFKSKGNNKIQTQPVLCILVTHLYTEFKFKMSICKENNGQKLKII